MVKAVFYVPENYNDNRLIPPACLLELQGFLLREFGGYTATGKVEGAWENPETGVVFKDVSTRYEVALAEESVDVLKEFLRGFKKKIGQDAIYFEIDKDAEIEML